MAKKNNLTTKKNYQAFILKDEKESAAKREAERLKRERRAANRAAVAESVATSMKAEEAGMEVDSDKTLTPAEMRIKEFLDSKKPRKITAKPVRETNQQKILRKKIEKRHRKQEEAKYAGMELAI